VPPQHSEYRHQYDAYQQQQQQQYPQQHQLGPAAAAAAPRMPTTSGATTPPSRMGGGNGALVVRGAGGAPDPMLDDVRYKALRTQAMTAYADLKQEEEKFNDWMRKMKAKFEDRVMVLKEQYARARDEIDMMDGAALRELERQTIRVQADSTLGREEKAARIRQLHEEYKRTFHPSDDYERMVANQAVEGLLSQLFGGMFGGAGAAGGILHPAGASVRIVSSAGPLPSGAGGAYCSLGGGITIEEDDDAERDSDDFDERRRGPAGRTRRPDDRYGFVNGASGGGGGGGGGRQDVRIEEVD